MQLYLLIAAGGALGSVLRFFLSGFVASHWGDAFPWGTLVINITGSFLIGFIADLTGPGGRWLASRDTQLFLMAGICGGYTTFSAFSSANPRPPQSGRLAARRRLYHQFGRALPARGLVRVYPGRAPQHSMTWLVWALLSAFFRRHHRDPGQGRRRGGQLPPGDRHPDCRRPPVHLGHRPRSCARRRPGAISRRTWCFLALSGLATGLSWLCYFRALQLGEASQVAPVDKLSVVFAMALAAVFLHERLTWQHWAGGGLILAGAILIALKF